jgi:toxin FitB
MIVLDTNVLSETLRPDPAISVKRWLAAQSRIGLFTTAITQAEMLYGVELLPAGIRRATLEKAVTEIFDEEFADRVLVFDSRAARAFSVIAAQRRQSGGRISGPDVLIDAIASSHGAAVATRNVTDFADCGIRIIDSWHA